MTVFTTALMKKGDQINVSLFCEPTDDEDNYSIRQVVQNFSTQIGFTRATPGTTSNELLALKLVLNYLLYYTLIIKVVKVLQGL